MQFHDYLSYYWITLHATYMIEWIAINTVTFTIYPCMILVNSHCMHDIRSHFALPGESGLQGLSKTSPLTNIIKSVSYLKYQERSFLFPSFQNGSAHEHGVFPSSIVRSTYITTVKLGDFPLDTFYTCNISIFKVRWLTYPMVPYCTYSAGAVPWQVFNATAVWQ